MAELNRKFSILLIVLACLWFGLLAGVSFLATPVKFLAPSLSLPVALDVGRQTFAFLNPVELLFAGLLLFGAGMGLKKTGAGRWELLLSGILLSLVLSQTLWLLPLLDSRVEVILQGGMPEASGMHQLYIGVDVLKLCLLGLIAGRQLGYLLK